jgi:hypothetical protein
MAVDAARKHELAACVDIARAVRKVGPEYGDAAAPDADVTIDGFNSGCDGAAADNQIEIAHSILTPASRLTLDQRAISLL